jgi:hypothetical protein
MQTDLEIWQATERQAPHRWLIRDAQPPRYWYGASDDGRGGWRFERIPDDALVGESERVADDGDPVQRDAVLRAFSEQVLKLR